MLYKFFKYSEFLLSSIINGQLYFSKVEDFNDPFEARFRYKIDNLNKKELERTIAEFISPNSDIIQKYIDSPYELEQRLNKINDYQYDNKGVCCFTSLSNLLNVYMWAHYANSSKGVCIAFDESLHFVHKECIEKHSFIADPQKHAVKYISHFPKCNPLDKDHFKPADLLILKQEAWQNEEETRFISPKHGLHYFEKNKIKAIYFGSGLNKDKKKTISSLVEMLPYKNVQLYDIVLKENTFELDYIAYKPN